MKASISTWAAALVLSSVQAQQYLVDLEDAELRLVQAATNVYPYTLEPGSVPVTKPVSPFQTSKATKAV